jgi:hypothetical protein
MFQSRPKRRYPHTREHGVIKQKTNQSPIVNSLQLAMMIVAADTHLSPPDTHKLIS